MGSDDLCKKMTISKKMKILFIKQLFYPEPTARSLDFAKSLISQGHSVQVLTSFPSYPVGKIYEGYTQKAFFKEHLEGVDIIRVPIYPYHGENGLKRILNYMSYAISAIIFGLFRMDKPDIVFAYHGALPVSLPAIFYKLFRRVPFVYDINDLWPDTLTATGMINNKFLIGIINAWCNVTYRLANHITVLSSGFKDELISRGVDSSKISITHHWSRDKEIQNKDIEDNVKSFFPDGKLNILYAGNIGKAQSLYSIIDGIQLINVDSVKVILNLLGDGIERTSLIDYVNSKDVKGVIFIDRVDSSEVGKYLQCADVLLAHLKDDALFRITIPSKIIGYLYAAKPILLGIKGDAESIIRDSKAGWIFEPDNSSDFADKVEKLFDLDKSELIQFGLNAKEHYNNNFTIANVTKKYIEIFKMINER